MLATLKVCFHMALESIPAQMEQYMKANGRKEK